jgi:sec-independent protein translocase protein TatA
MIQHLPPLFAILPDISQMMLLMVVAVMLFGKRLPEVAKQAGRTLGEVKKYVSGLQAELNSAIYTDTPSGSSKSSANISSYSYNDYDDRDEQTAPKFEPPPAEPPAQS